MRMLVLCLSCAILATTSQAQSPLTYKVSKIEANLFYADKATFSENIIDNPNFNLWNVLIAEGSAAGPSTQTLIKVFVQASGKGQLNASGVALEVIVSGPGTPSLTKKFNVSFFELDRVNCYAFMVDDTGCAPLTIKARLTGKHGGSTMNKTIPFECGD